MRSDYAAEVVRSACTLASSSYTREGEKQAILEVADRLLNAIWQVEWQFLTDFAMTPQQLNTKTKVFWDEVHTKLVAAQDVYDFEAVFGETVNPPNTSGRVVVWVQPIRSAQRFQWTLIPPCEPKSADKKE